MLVNQTQLADILDHSTRSIARWIKHGMPVRPDGLYDTAEIIYWLIARKRESDDKTSPHVRLETAKAGLAEHELKERRASMVTRETVSELTGEVFAIVRDRCKVIPGNVAGLIAVETDAGSIERLLTKEIDDALQSISEE